MLSSCLQQGLLHILADFRRLAAAVAHPECSSLRHRPLLHLKRGALLSCAGYLLTTCLETLQVCWLLRLMQAQAHMLSLAEMQIQG